MSMTALFFTICLVCVSTRPHRSIAISCSIHSLKPNNKFETFEIFIE